MSSQPWIVDLYATPWYFLFAHQQHRHHRRRLIDVPDLVLGGSPICWSLGSSIFQFALGLNILRLLPHDWGNLLSINWLNQFSIQATGSSVMVAPIHLPHWDYDEGTGVDMLRNCLPRIE